jgi:hypothetical protein
MNKRIKELIFEAVTFRLDPDSGCYEAQVCPEDLEYLVELIVGECAQVCLAQRDPANLNYKPSEKFAEAVKQHFGVKR